MSFHRQRFQFSGECFSVASCKSKVAGGSEVTPPFSFFPPSVWLDTVESEMSKATFVSTSRCFADTLSLTFQGPRLRLG